MALIQIIYFTIFILLGPRYSNASLNLVHEDGSLVCNATGMTLKFNFTKFISSGRPLTIHFNNTNDPACSLQYNSFANLINNQLQIHANFNTCNINSYFLNGNLVYNQTVLLTYGTNPKSDRVIREEVIKFDVECTKMSNSTVYLEALGHINVTRLAEKTFTKIGNATFDIVFNRKTNNSFNEAETSSALILGATMYFELQLKSQRNDLKISPQTCYATNARNSKDKFSLIKNRCPNSDDSTVKLQKGSSTNQLFHWEAQSFRFFESSNAVYFACDVVICESSNPSDVCKRCPSSTTRRRRELKSTDGQVESAITVASPLYVLVDAHVLQDKNNPADTLNKDDPSPGTSRIFSGTKGTIIAILAVCLAIAILFVIVKTVTTQKSSSLSRRNVAIDEQL